MSRTLHLIDLQNLTRSSCPTADDIGATAAAYRRSAPVLPRDLVIVAAQRTGTRAAYGLLRLEAGRVWPDASHRTHRDGAVAALVGSVDPVWFSKTGIGHVCIGSGDQRFTPFATALIEAGTAVTVVSRPQRLSASLAVTANATVALSIPAAAGERCWAA